MEDTSALTAASSSGEPGASAGVPSLSMETPPAGLTEREMKFMEHIEIMTGNMQMMAGQIASLQQLQDLHRRATGVSQDDILEQWYAVANDADNAEDDAMDQDEIATEASFKVG